MNHRRKETCHGSDSGKWSSDERKQLIPPLASAPHGTNWRIGHVPHMAMKKEKAIVAPLSKTHPNRYDEHA